VKITAAAIQLTSTEDSEANLLRSERMIAEAAGRGARLVALPENFAFLRSEGETIPCAQPLDGEFLTHMSGAARRHRIYLLCGSIPEAIPEMSRIYNTSVLLDPEGRRIAVYRKIHLFDVRIEGRADFQESRFVESGTEVVTASMEFGCAGLTICYDLRFPELYRRLTQAGARVIFVPSAFTEYTGKDHWEVLLRARAIENQVYLIAPAQFGRHNPRRASYGKSMIVNPWGTVLVTAPDCEGVILADLDFDLQDRIRNELPSLDHIKLV
jgi:predicted amidohydrolase